MKKSLQENFKFIQQMLDDAFKVESQYFEYPYEGIEKIDKGFRRMMWTTYDTPDFRTLFEDAGSTPSYEIIVIKSTLKFYNIIVLIPLENNPDIINIGPFLEEEITEPFLHEVFEDANIAQEKLQLMKSLYFTLPILALDDLLIFIHHLFAHFQPEFAQVEPKHHIYMEKTNKIVPSAGEMNTFIFQYSIDYRTYLMEYLDGVASGVFHVSLDRLNTLTAHILLHKQASPGELRQTLLNLNAYLELRLLQTTVHPMYIMRLFHSYLTIINTTVNHQKLLNLPSEMTRKYCLLVRNYSNVSYSQLIRNVLAYIDQYLCTDLSLSIIADYFNKNASFLSKQFSEETGQSLTSYIRKTRMQLAIKYLNTTNLSISEIAGNVGIQDYVYFSKQFKKEIGVTPQEYRKMLG